MKNYYLKRLLSIVLAVTIVFISSADLLAVSVSAKTAATNSAKSSSSSEDAYSVYNKGCDAYSKQDYKTARECFRLSADNGYDIAMYWYAIMCENGMGGDVDYGSALKYYDMSKDTEPKSQYRLGLMYYYGRGVERDYSKAAKLFYNCDDTNAQIYYGYMWEKGLGVEQNYENARIMYEKAGKKSGDALYRLGNLYYKGNGVKQDYAKALEYYKKAAVMNDPNAMYTLGQIYAYGAAGVSKDPATAFDYFINAAKLGNIDSFHYVANVYYNYTKADGITDEYKKAYLDKAEELYTYAADNGCVNAMKTLGTVYYDGNYGYSQDLVKSFKYYKKAADTDPSDETILRQVGLMYAAGEGVSQSYEAAIEYFNAAVNLGDPDSMRYMGIIYESGLGVKADLDLASKYYSAAAEYGNIDATTDLDRVNTVIKVEKSNESKPAQTTNNTNKKKSDYGWKDLAFDGAKALGSGLLKAGKFVIQHADTIIEVTNSYENIKERHQDEDKSGLLTIMGDFKDLKDINESISNDINRNKK